MDLLKIKKGLNTPFDYIINIFKRNGLKFKLYWILFLFYLTSYILLNYYLIKKVENIYINPLSFGHFLFYLILVIIKITLLYKILDSISLTKWDRSNFSYLAIGYALSDIYALILNIGFSKFSDITSFIDNLKTANFSFFGNLLMSIIILTLIYLFLPKRRKFVEDYDDKGILENILVFFVLPVLMWFMVVISYVQNQMKILEPNFRFSYIQQAYIGKESILLFIILIVFFLFTFKILWLNKKLNLIKKELPLTKITGVVKGHASFTYEQNILNKWKIEKTLTFILIKNKNKNYYISDIKSGTIIYPIGFNLIYGDEIEIFGYEITNKNLNTGAKIDHIVPLYITLKNRSSLRDIIGKDFTKNLHKPF